MSERKLLSPAMLAKYRQHAEHTKEMSFGIINGALLADQAKNVLKLLDIIDVLARENEALRTDGLDCDGCSEHWPADAMTNDHKHRRVLCPECASSVVPPERSGE